MAIPRCTANRTVDDSRYSSPVPVIGLYIASASLLCMLLMLCDILAGFRARKRWLPCKLFTLNSVTLTLLSVAAKLPVDLTTPMPSPRDQLSKLSGTTFICISMCFLMPSLGDNSASETLTNMVALTIFVVTVFVNICMQLSTGVIAPFFTEHIIILCSLLVLLLIMWQCYWEFTVHWKAIRKRNREEFLTERQGSVFCRLKLCCLYGSNPQLMANSSMRTEVCMISMATSILCTLCCATLIQAAFRSVIQKKLEFCSGNSDYDWSMPLILVTQALTVIIGSSAVLFRYLSMFRFNIGVMIGRPPHDVDYFIQRNPVLGIPSRFKKYGRTVRCVFLESMRLLEVLIGFLPLIIRYIIWRYACPEVYNANQEWHERKSKEDVERWINQNKSKPSSHLSRLLDPQNYPYHQFHTMEVTDSFLPDQKGVYVSSLSLVLLVRIAQVVLPENHSTPLIEAYDEAKEVFYYTEKNINSKSSKNDNILLFAKSVWAGQEFSCLLPKIFNTSTNTLPQSDLDRGLSILTQLKVVLPNDPVWGVLGIIVDFINRKAYSTIQELTTSVEQLFVDMVRVMLAQLPNAISKSLSNSTDEEYEEYVKLAFKMTCKVVSIAKHIQWSYPPGCNFTSFIPREASPQSEISQV